ncbi:Phosphohydrolase [Bacillus pseudomycoides]
MVFRKVINLKNDTDMTLENATKQIVSWHQGVEVLPLDRHEVEHYEGFWCKDKIKENIAHMYGAELYFMLLAQIIDG